MMPCKLLRLANSTWGMAKKLEKNIGKCHGDIRLISPNEMDFCIFKILNIGKQNI
jgi:hypothetical protein